MFERLLSQGDRVCRLRLRCLSAWSVRKCHHTVVETTKSSQFGGSRIWWVWEPEPRTGTTSVSSFSELRMRSCGRNRKEPSWQFLNRNCFHLTKYARKWRFYVFSTKFNVFKPSICICKSTIDSGLFGEPNQRMKFKHVCMHKPFAEISTLALFL